ncbi:MAG TPA: hypothetical protein VHL99_09145 [Candidatus Binatia bacterium]|nr:hypothetical protein [Candidatus Binatia bacterium]
MAVLILAGWMAPCGAAAAGPAMRSAAGVGVAGPRMQPGAARGVRVPIFFGSDGFTNSTEVTIQQSRSAPAAESPKAETNRVYVPPRWVDGGYGVQVLVPGYWSEAEATRTR